MSLRRHQSETCAVLDEVKAGAAIRILYELVTPGGGKSAIPIAAAAKLIPAIADKICVVVPRRALQEQGEREFLDPFFREMFGREQTIRTATNDVNPCRGTDGFITTYQALGLPAAKVVREEFKRHRYIVVLDEFHHVEQNSDWNKAIAPLVRDATFVILMSGTLSRGDGKPIAFVPYSQTPDGLCANPESDPAARVIRYSRRDALKEKAILPICFHLHDASISWGRNGIVKKVRSFSHVESRDQSTALFCALNTGFADNLLKIGVDHWLHWRNTVQASAKILIVTAGFMEAGRAAEKLKANGIHCEVATSHNTAVATTAIKRFKAGETKCLVTIAMAYEGLDVPQVTHLVALTRIRSRPWIEQMVARAVRIDKSGPAYEKQVAFVFAPDDDQFRKIVKKIEAEQEDALGKSPSQQKGEQIPPGVFDPNAPKKTPGIDMFESEVTARREKHVGLGQQQDLPLAAVSTPPLPLTETEKEKAIRTEIKNHIHSFCHQFGYEPQDINKEIKAFFGKPRGEMTMGELQSVRQRLLDFYPLQGDPVVRVPGARQPRKMFSTPEQRNTAYVSSKGW